MTYILFRGGGGGWLSGQGHWSLTTSLRSQMWAYPLIPSPVLWFPYTYQWLGFTDWFVITVMFLLIWDSVGLMINYNWKLIDLRYPHSLFIQLIVNAHNQLITPKKIRKFSTFYLESNVVLHPLYWDLFIIVIIV